MTAMPCHPEVDKQLNQEAPIVRYSNKKMRLVSPWSLHLISAAILLLSKCSGGHAFSVPSWCNKTNVVLKKTIMMPLQIDQTLGLASDDNASRGVYLNLGVAGFIMGSLQEASLMAGSGFAGLLLASAFLITKKNSMGNILGAGVASLLISYTMGKKFRRSGKFMPAGLIAGSAGVITLVYNLIEVIRPRGKKGGTLKEAVDPTEEDESIA